MTFYQRLLSETETERQNFQSIGLIQRAVEKGVTRELYAKYLEQAYHHVRFTVPLLELAIENCTADDTAYINTLAEYVKEESGHDEWILDDIKALGVDAQAVRHGQGGFACRVMIAYAHYAIEHISPYALLGMVHVLEGMSVELAQKAAGAIAASFAPNPPNAFSYLTSHGALDIEHVGFFESTVNTINDPKIEAIIIAAAKDFYILFGNMFRELEAAL
ncbi:MAG: iron-containing redox enzyme family protein [Rhodospirillales bacterium]|nr:iron-containing redox enzyme family protein [Rhodospirillales bacterium]